MTRIVLCMAFVLLISGCGYRPLLKPQSSTIEAVYISRMDNQTAYRNVGSSLLIALRAHLAQKGIRLARDTSDASLVLDIRVFSISVETNAIFLESNRESPAGQNWRMHATVRGRGVNDTDFAAPEVFSVSEVAEVSAASADTAVLNDRAKQLLTDALAQQISLFVLTFQTE
ncbi:MAG: hypothetical protein JXR76_15685 [Deltaproteobacteria bacterium]|nr:hypothetical protein [Deltaproteobacteria bacterium]